MKIGIPILACGALVLVCPMSFAAWAFSEGTMGISGNSLSVLILMVTIGVYLVIEGIGLLQAAQVSARLIRDTFSLVVLVGGWATAVAGMLVHFGWVFWILLALTSIGLAGGTLLRCPQCNALIAFPKGRTSLPAMSRDMCRACGYDLNAPLGRKAGR